MMAIIAMTIGDLYTEDERDVDMEEVPDFVLGRRRP
jgi:hypothetical protein